MELSTMVMPLLLAFISGVLMAVQGSLNAAFSKVIGLLETTLIVHVIGALILLVLVLLLGLGKGNLHALPQAPWYVYLGGVISIFIVYLVAASIPAAGMANATTAILVGQILTAVLLDHIGGFGLLKTPYSWNDLAGLSLLASGAYLLLR